MKRLLLATAGALMISAPVVAQMTDYSDLIRTRDITGGTIYTMNASYDEGSWGTDPYYTSADTEWNDIGEIEDVILNREGKMVGIVAEIGGFLDIGDKHVMLPVEDVKLVAVDDKSYSYVTRLSEEQLEELESVDEAWWN
ncbi:PRC-barrel domain protein [Hoeflea halophila]|uniref:PRC-barrel domain protein n=1 Tax=Hoeflea halophila TaxID=714899 RepID=A0A286IBS5_9HYPH|nr:PRC-barrel domain-containing protein [Hoeflea halophila]SOE17583.1 PRC-barrel domain protein [Hoeflea halophila]